MWTKGGGGLQSTAKCTMHYAVTAMYRLMIQRNNQLKKNKQTNTKSLYLPVVQKTSANIEYRTPPPPPPLSTHQRDGSLSIDKKKKEWNTL